MSAELDAQRAVTELHSENLQGQGTVYHGKRQFNSFAQKLFFPALKVMFRLSHIILEKV